jgi:Flp pilus assembly protein TadG
MDRGATSESKRYERGQTFVVLALVIPVLIIFTGMALDYGMAYVEKTGLSKAVDAAALEGMRNLSQGNAVAERLATDTFNANVQVLGTYGIPPTFTFTQSVDASGNATVSIQGTVYYQPMFLRIIPGFPSPVAISASATTSRQPLYMALVLDQSYSMTQNGGSTALPTAVSDFIDQFDDTNDHVAVVSFATYATVGVQMSNSPPFKNAVKSYVNSMGFTLQNCYTFSQTGLDNGLAQINSATVPSNGVKVIVFFTDGWPNMVQDGLNCASGSGTRTTLNFSQCDPGDVTLGLCNSLFPLAVFSTSGGSANCGGCYSYPSYAYGSCYPPPAWMTFYSRQSNSYQTMTMSNIWNEAFYRAESSANTALSQNVQIFSVGLGNAITNQPVAQSFLYQVANDPNSPTFSLSLPQGQALFAPTAAQLDGIFQQIVAKILLRLTQ